MTRPDLDAIEARALAATPGPWFREEDCGPNVYDSDDGVRYIIARCDRGDGTTDAAFIAAARSDIPALVARVRELEAEIRETIGAHDDGRCTVARLRDVMRGA